MPIKLDDLDSVLRKVGPFRAITSRRNKKPLLSRDEHIDLIKEKAGDATKMEHHITLFRVQDKRKLPPKERDEHTVSGPCWTPCASAGFVIGASTQDHRIYLATETSLSNKGLLGRKGAPSIYAREISSALSLGYSARKSKANENFGNTNRKPEVVLSPPSSPVPFLSDDLETIMDVSVGWNGLPFSQAKLNRLTTPKEDRFQKCLEDEGLEMEDLEDGLVKIVLNKKIFPLIEQGIIDLSNMIGMDEDTLKEILENKEVFMVLSREELAFAEVISLYSKYIEDRDDSIENVDIYDLYDLSMKHEKALEALLDDLDLTLSQIFAIYKEYGDDISIFADSNVISFLQEFSSDIDYERLLEINAENPDLFGAMITDPNHVIQDKGVEEFISRFTEFQDEVEAAQREGIYSFEDSPYDRVASWAVYDGCPEGYLPEDMEEDEDYEDYEESHYGSYGYDETESSGFESDGSSSENESEFDYMDSDNDSSENESESDYIESDGSSSEDGSLLGDFGAIYDDSL